MDRPTSQTFTVGKLARRAGVGVETIRFYERENLLPEPDRAESSGYRMYSEDAVKRLAFIGRAKELGFTLRETRELLALRSSTELSCASLRTRAQEKLADVRSKIQVLRRIEAVLIDLSEACPSDEASADGCPILAALDGTET